MYFSKGGKNYRDRTEITVPLSFLLARASLPKHLVFSKYYYKTKA
jgi:hypothetical protein